MLDNNTVRMNGYNEEGKRAHVDILVKNTKVRYIVKNEIVEKIVPSVPHFSDIPKMGFENGLTAVTSYNYYNWIGKERTTEKA